MGDSGKNKGGRPTKYDPAMCERVIELMRDGASKLEVCAELGIRFPTFQDYQQRYPEFREAVEYGQMLSQAWWEKQGRLGAIGKVPINPATWIFNMCNRFRDDWKQRHEHEHSGKLTLEQLVAASRKAADGEGAA